MAQVDFSNAVLDVKGATKPMTLSTYMYLATPYFTDNSQNTINTNSNASIITNTPTKVSILYTGTFSASGTGFNFIYAGGEAWSVSNISFNSGDTYAFVIDIEVSGNS